MFTLDPKLQADSFPVADVGLTQVRLINDHRFPWLILVPKRAGVSELYELSPLDQTMLTFEVSQIGKALREMTGADKINIAALGNQVPQLHVHVIARFKTDAAWPNPVWGSGQAVPYSEEAAKAFIAQFAEQF